MQPSSYLYLVALVMSTLNEMDVEQQSNIAEKHNSLDQYIYYTIVQGEMFVQRKGLVGSNHKISA